MLSERGEPDAQVAGCSRERAGVERLADTGQERRGCEHPAEDDFGRVEERHDGRDDPADDPARLLGQPCRVGISRGEILADVRTGCGRFSQLCEGMRDGSS